MRMRDRFDTGWPEAARYREKAALMRRQALTAATHELWTIPLENAELYERLAEAAEATERQSRRPDQGRR